MMFSIQSCGEYYTKSSSFLSSSAAAAAAAAVRAVWSFIHSPPLPFLSHSFILRFNSSRRRSLYTHGTGGGGGGGGGGVVK